MEKSSKARAQESERKNQSLMQQLKDLEKEWNLLQLVSKKPRNQRRCSTGSDSGSSTSSILTSFDKLLENSPRGLMSSLQRDRSPFDDGVRVKNCDVAVEEILRDRRAAIMSGKLKGRRLFCADEVEIMDLNYDDGGGESGLTDDFKQSCSFSDSCLSVEKAMVVEEKTKTKTKTVVVEVANAVEKRGGGRRRLIRGGGGCMAWFAFVLIMLTIGLILIRCNGKSVHEYDFILVPT
ncbi:hypothetical protein BUALT_Bualt07G0089600 [Buddleja alternifolia]|uniref:Uncharacterized protein n=1 Tax=Buddleja alternifolia TaxID=168488 RepID=A0AAV6XK27_9LAMI|nr:hypothetical protein BUALT_Bualt07G0089600 [Buddleja alternifolia]